MKKKSKPIPIGDDIKSLIERFQRASMSGEAYEDRVAREATERARARVDAARIPPLYRRMRDSERLTTLVPSNTLRDAVQAVDRGASRIVFRGPSGVGKTSLAAALLQTKVAGGARGLFLSASALEAFAPCEREALTCDILLLDDVGEEPDAALATVRQIIHRRHDEKRAIWVTTKLDTAAFIRRLGESAARRMLEFAVIVEMKGRRDVA